MEPNPKSVSSNSKSRSSNPKLGSSNSKSRWNPTPSQPQVEVEPNSKLTLSRGGTQLQVKLKQLSKTGSSNSKSWSRDGTQLQVRVDSKSRWNLTSSLGATQL
ncbi:hypothetical protein GBA52_024777 [Prunus armeniaca]|nr:hypothetical protein GBA52_024777 [Prunus armeniaca]